MPSPPNHRLTISPAFQGSGVQQQQDYIYIWIPTKCEVAAGNGNLASSLERKRSYKSLPSSWRGTLPFTLFLTQWCRVIKCDSLPGKRLCQIPKENQCWHTEKGNLLYHAASVKLMSSHSASKTVPQMPGCYWRKEMLRPLTVNLPDFDSYVIVNKCKVAYLSHI